MADTPVVDADELDAPERLETIQRERRVVVRTQSLDAEREAVLRWDRDTSYCDTPTRLHTHDEESAMLTYVENQGDAE